MRTIEEIQDDIVAMLEAEGEAGKALLAAWSARKASDAAIAAAIDLRDTASECVEALRAELRKAKEAQ